MLAPGIQRRGLSFKRLRIHTLNDFSGKHPPMPPRAEALPVERYPSLRHLAPMRDPVKAAASVAALVREWSPASRRFYGVPWRLWKSMRL